MKGPTELPFWFRQFIAWSLKSAGIEKVPDRAEAWPEYFDNTDGIGEVKRKLFYKDKRSGVMLPYKGRAKPVPAEKKIGIEAHITAVAYGTTKRARHFWWDAIVDGLVPEEFAERYGYSLSQGAMMSDEDSAIAHRNAAERMALHQRFWKVPYHYVGLLNGDILYNNQVSRRTFHGNGGNGPMIGTSLEGNYPGLAKNRKAKHDDMDDFVIETGRATLRLAHKKETENGSDLGLFNAHRVYSAGRLGDPGEEYWREIGKPMAKELGLEINYEFKHGSGNHICREWDDEGLVNYRGRRL